MVAALTAEVEGFLEHCLDTDKSIVTVSSYRQALEAFTRWLQTNHPEVVTIESLTLSHVQGFRRYLRLRSSSQGREMAPSTQAKYLSILRSWLRYVQTEGRAAVLDCEAVALPKRPARGGPPRLADADLEGLLSQPDTTRVWGLRDRAIIATLLSTGLRVSRLCALDRRDVREDLLGRVPIAPLRLERWGSATVGLDQRAQLYLQEYLAARRDSYKPLFIRHKPGKRLDDDDPHHRLTRQMVNRMLEKYSRQAGIRYIVSPSMLGRRAR